ncbi:MAG TPA: hypothetical protein VH681_11560, partial [Nitrospiraceae bacterium]
FESNEVLRVDDVLDSATVQVIAGRTHGVVAPLAVEASGDGRYIYIVGHGSNRVLVVDSSSTGVRSIPCGCQAAGLRRLADGDTFELTRDRTGAVAILRTNQGEPLSFYVAPAQLAPRGHGQSRSLQRRRD